MCLLALRLNILSNNNESAQKTRNHVMETQSKLEDLVADDRQGIDCYIM
jgi:hypothetical protein